MSLISLLVVALACVCASHALRWNQLHTEEEQHAYTFDHFIAEHRRAYVKGSEEYMHRAAVFRANKEKIMAHNRDTTKTHTLAMNHFGDLTSKEFSKRQGLDKLALRTVARKHSMQPPKTLLRETDLPDKVDWRIQGIVTPVKDQGNCGSCWAFASTETLESYVAMTTVPPTLMELSPQQVVSCVPNTNQCGGVGGCQGGVPSLVFDYVAENGMTTEWIMPYTSHDGKTCNPTCDCPYNNTEAAITVTGYVSLPSNNYTAVMNALAFVGPLAVNVQANTWQFYKSGVFASSSCDYKNTDIDHVVQLVGYGTDAVTGKPYWLVRNSWTPMWGEQGYIRLERNPNPVCNPDTTPLDGTGCAKGPNPSPPVVTVCGTCGILYDTSYPVGARIINA